MSEKFEQPTPLQENPEEQRIKPEQFAETTPVAPTPESARETEIAKPANETLDQRKKDWIIFG